MVFSLQPFNIPLRVGGVPPPIVLLTFKRLFFNLVSLFYLDDLSS